MHKVIIGIIAAVALIGGVSEAQAAAFADVNCGAAPTTGGAPSQVKLERATSAAGPFTALPLVAFPVPAPGTVADAIPTGVVTVVYRCSYGNAAGFGGVGPVSDSQIVIQIPGSPTDKPSINIRFQ